MREDDAQPVNLDTHRRTRVDFGRGYHVQWDHLISTREPLCVSTAMKQVEIRSAGTIRIINHVRLK